MRRRAALVWLIRTFAVALGAGLAALFGVFVRAVCRTPRPLEWALACRLDQLVDGVPRACVLPVREVDGWYRDRRSLSVFVLRDGSELMVFSRRCTHLGCAVDWDSGRKAFLCPCHGGAFDPRGAVLAGPPSRALDRLEHRVRGPYLEVRPG